MSSAASNTAAVAQPHGQQGGTHVAGGPGVWLFVVGDMVVFGLYFLAYAYYYVQSPQAFQQAAATLSLSLGLLNTLLLLTGSWFVACAVQDWRAGRVRGARRRTGWAIAAGAGFIGIKAIEWNHLFEAGHTLMSGDFFMFYFMLTGIHLAHVILGLGVLCFLLALTRRQAAPNAGSVRTMEAGGILWHLVDLLWIVLFSLFYLFGTP